MGIPQNSTENARRNLLKQSWVDPIWRVVKVETSLINEKSEENSLFYIEKRNIWRAK